MFSFICDGNLKKAVWDGQRSLGRQSPFFLGVCVCVCVCGAEGGLGGHNRASNVALQAKY